MRAATLLLLSFFLSCGGYDSEEVDYPNGGWAYIDAGQLIIYGHGVE